MADSIANPRTAPTTEKGRPASTQIGGGLLPWAAFMDDREKAPDVTWPKSVTTYTAMQTDAQIKGLLLATTLPIRRFRWEIDPNGARPEVVAHIARSLNLPIRGQDPPPQRRRNRFSWDRHLAHALRALAYGHFYFEQVYEYSSPRDGGDGLLHLKKLGTRPPRTIFNIMLEDNGELKAIQQNVNTGVIGAGLASSILDLPTLEASRLVPYIWDSEDDADWVGRSILRACFRDWIVKDRLLRVDATKHERNSMGIPWFEVDSSASQGQIDDLAETARRMRAGEESGGAGPGKLTIKGVDGTLPDTIGSVRFHDEQMSKAFLLLFFNLGTTETGSRSLGSEFIDWYADTQAGIADWARDCTQAGQVEDEVALNWGEDEQPPLLSYTRLESAEMGIADLAQAVTSGLVAMDPELSQYVVNRWQLPKGAVIDDTPPPPPAPGMPGAPVPPPVDPNAPPPAPEPVPATRAMAGRLADACRAPMRWPDLARAVGSDPKNGTARRARDELIEAGTIVKRGKFLAPRAAADLELPDRELRRQPTEVEVTAAVNFASLDNAFTQGRDSLVGAVKAAQTVQVEALLNAVRSANGNPETLATITCEPISADVLLPHLQTAARQGQLQAQAEHAAQTGPAAKARPRAAAQADADVIEKTLIERARAAVSVLAAALAGAAAKRATAVASLPPADAAAKVGEYLAGLSDASLDTQLGGAVWQSVNTGRSEYMRANNPKAVYASELLDEATCDACAEEDGTEWPNVEAAEEDYPSGGGYIDCLGGLRCRGTLVSVY